MWETILWFLIFGAIFYFLMRMGGCGAHGHGGHGQRDSKQSWAVRDPVCGAEGRPDEAPASAEHNGTMYYFCSEKCRELFLADPDRYATHPGRTEGEHHDH